MNMKTNKIFAVVVGAIIGGFLIKSYHKLHDKPTKEEIYRRMKAEAEARRMCIRANFGQSQPKCPVAEADPFTMRHDPSAALGKIDASLAMMGSC